jgi:hypothetical protein
MVADRAKKSFSNFMASNVKLGWLEEDLIDGVL